MISFHTCPLASQEGKETGGMNVYVLELSKQLSRMGIRVDVFTRSQDDDQPHVVQVDPLFRVIHVPAGPEAPVPKKQLMQHVPAFVHNTLAFIAAHGAQYDVMHCHYYLSGLAGLDIARALGGPLPITMTFHTLALMKNLVARNDSEYEDAQRVEAEYRLVRDVQHIIAPSESDMQYVQYLYQAAPQQVSVIPPGVDLTHFRPIPQKEAKAALGMDACTRHVLFCGRIEPLKGIDSLLYALKIMRERRPDLNVCLWIIGGDISQPKDQWSKELQKLERLRGLLKLDSVVHFAGQQQQDVLPVYYNAADVVVMPSHYESFGMVAAEAMACGTPVITTNVAGISSLIDDKHDELVSSVNNPLLLASQIELLLSDSARRAQVSQHVLDTVQDLNWRTIASRIVGIYEDTLIHDPQ
jgi:D-inositol-3-phosphate glycosyltransferase